MPDPDDEASYSQPEPDASSDGDGSWKDDPITQDPDQDRSVEHVIKRTQPTRRSSSDAPSSDTPAPDGSTAHIRDPDGTPVDNPSG